MSKKLSVEELELLLASAKREEEAAQARQAFAGQLSRLLNDSAAGQKTLDKPQPKVVRDSFTLPEDDYQLIQDLRDRAMDFRINATKGEVLRAGLHALTRMSNDEYCNILKTVEKLKPGRRKE